CPYLGASGSTSPTRRSPAGSSRRADLPPTPRVSSPAPDSSRTTGFYAGRAPLAAEMRRALPASAAAGDCVSHRLGDDVTKTRETCLGSSRLACKALGWKSAVPEPVRAWLAFPRGCVGWL